MIFNDNDVRESTYFIFSKPSSKYMNPVTQNVYDFDIDFVKAEVYANTMERKKIEFLNKLAIDWSTAIK